MAFDDYRSVPAWRQGMALVAVVYRFASGLPSDEKAGLAAALKRSASAIPGRIADVADRAEPEAAIKGLEQVLAQLRELDTQLLLCQELRLVGRRSIRKTRRPLLNLAANLQHEAERMAA